MRRCSVSLLGQVIELFESASISGSDGGKGGNKGGGKGGGKGGPGGKGSAMPMIKEEEEDGELLYSG